MRICVVGGGGREHALCWALSASPLVDALICAPGNGGISEIARCVPVAADDITGLIDMARREQIDFVVVGPELPLVAGLVDRLEAAGIPAFGPTAAAAELESSKGFTKDLCRRYDIPTARYQRFNEREAAKQYVRAAGAPIVVKADGLAAGKGVVLAQSQNEAFQAIEDILGGQFGAAGNEVVIEEYLQGEEASFFALVDGENVLPLATAQDHKAAHDGDSGPNTGGMGAYSPAPVMTETLTAQVLDTIIKPTVKAMADMGRPFKGVLFAGLMLTESGPHLLEYNVRFGDPECQVLMMRLQSDLLPALIAARDGELKDFDLRWRQEVALTVVLASRGYPGAYTTGSTISNLDQAAAPDHIEIFHAGTARQDGNIIATGGRVLGVTALGATVSEAQMRAYAAIKTIDWPEGFYRSDIGWRAVAREAAS